MRNPNKLAALVALSFAAVLGNAACSGDRSTLLPPGVTTPAPVSPKSSETIPGIPGNIQGYAFHNDGTATVTALLGVSGIDVKLSCEPGSDYLRQTLPDGSLHEGGRTEACADGAVNPGDEGILFPTGNIKFDAKASPDQPVLTAVDPRG